jgi:uncharacterized cupredoxin-like copper-binding protein
MRNTIFLAVCLACTLLWTSTPTLAQTPTENDYYKIITLPVPEGIVLEVGGLTLLPTGSIAAATRRGEIWTIDNPYMANGAMPQYRLFAKGMHENLGLAWHDGALFTAQRGELTKVKDSNGDGIADRYETVYAWPISGHYHEYSFGPKIAADGSMFVTGNVAFGNAEWWRGESRVPWRGWTMRITQDGKMEPFATGMRSPCGIGMIDGEFFYADNQGDWMGSGGLIHVEKGDFTGHPGGLRWADRPESPVKIRLNDIYSRSNPRFSPPGKAIKPENIENETPIPLFAVAKDVPGVKLPAVWLPHAILGISTSEIIVDTTNGAFGPFAGQIFIGDQGQSKIDRVFLEKVKGVYQGAAFAFREGFQSGVLRMCWGTDGSMFVGQTNRGWGSTGKDPWGLQRLAWSGKMPFEMKTIRAKADGFEIEFTQQVDKKTAANPDNYEISSFIYKYHPVYGSPVVNTQEHLVHAAVVSKDGRSVRLVVDSLRENYIFEVKLSPIRAYEDDIPLLHDAGYYTLNKIPDGDRLAVARRSKPIKKRATEEETEEEVAAVATPKVNSAPGIKNAPVAKSPDGPAAAAATPKVAPSKPLAKRTTKKPDDWDKIDQNIVIGTLPGLKYNRTFVTMRAGSRVKWTFSNNDDMPHNLVLVKPATANDVGTAAMSLGLKGAEMNYVPKSGSVLFHTKLTGPGASDVIYFVAPPTPGDYVFMCTVPGHAAVMRGVLRVTK